ncbi:hypothetical protein FXB40_11015 [Bradyrhizobium rifense]|uniref:Uncharacterized protein n=1 Tax=Bradyrhizobium rifense TaxID=515499 RepID=A0A5D3KL28_9BRAD|nr:hypothetical protein FXB40_11015 [Bradyrhizobium rifense]
MACFERCRHKFAIFREPFCWVRLVLGSLGDDGKHAARDRRTRLLEAATAAMMEFERRESDFRKKDQAERAAELRLPLDKINVH